MIEIALERKRKKDGKKEKKHEKYDRDNDGK